MCENGVTGVAVEAVMITGDCKTGILGGGGTCVKQWQSVEFSVPQASQCVDRQHIHQVA
jgi:hypothetical protein